jgi:large subunit ribosomal protein L2
MPLKTFKPTSPSRRFYSVLSTKDITKTTPERSLLDHQHSTGGRNNNGRITSRFRGGGHKQRYRIVDFRRDKIGVPANVAAIEYDPNRTSRLALLHYADGEKRYILAPDGIKVGDQVVSSRNGDIKPGNSLPLRFIPLGTLIHNVELRKGKGGQLVRSAGAAATLMAKDGDYAQVRLPSTEIRKVHLDCRATIGQVSNLDHKNVSLGKAGRKRWLGKRPHNRGVTMNPVDHPMGGGEGRTSGGRHPCSPWGQLAKGAKTRNNKRTDNMIVRRRGSKGLADAAFTEEGPVRRRPPREQDQQGGRRQDQDADQDLVASLHHHPRGRWPHVRRAQRAQVRPRVRDGEHGRSQVRRVRADAYLPRSLRRPQIQGQGQEVSPGFVGSGYPAVPNGIVAGGAPLVRKSPTSARRSGFLVLSRRVRSPTGGCQVAPHPGHHHLRRGRHRRAGNTG